MAMMSDSEVRSLANTLENYEAREKRRELEKREERKESQRKWMELLYTGAGVAGAAGIGFMHGRFEDDQGNFFIPRTTLPADITVGTLGVLVGFGMGYMGKREGGKKEEGSEAGRAIFQLSRGILDGATAMYFRKHARAGKLSNKFWAGEPELLGPQTHNYPSIGAAPPVNAAMTDSQLAAALRRNL
ncbi:MAG TPA: hypothetical protein VJN18_02940 [Polyangiaceae bacterium]|nr:hypothetical protein [Polyangiaceae bacterium]